MTDELFLSWMINHEFKCLFEALTIFQIALQNADVSKMVEMSFTYHCKLLVWLYDSHFYI